MAEHVDPIADDELLYRRIHASPSIGHYDPTRDSQPSPKAFHPQKHDSTGISLSRAKSASHSEFLAAEQFAQGRNPEGYYLAVLRAGDLRTYGIAVQPRPEPDNPGHVELPEMNYTDRKRDQVAEWEQLLASKLTIQILGPFLPKTQEEPPSPEQ